MATSLLARKTPSQTNQVPNFLRISLNFLRSFSASSSKPPSSPNKPNNGKKKKKRKNLFEVAQFLPNWGIGYHMAKSHWTNVSYEITKINLYKDGRHGKAWGIAYKDGLPADAPKKISGVHKRCWRYVPSLSKAKKTAPNSSNPTQPTTETTVQTA